MLIFILIVYHALKRKPGWWITVHCHFCALQINSKARNKGLPGSKRKPRTETLNVSKCNHVITYQESLLIKLMLLSKVKWIQVNNWWPDWRTNSSRWVILGFSWIHNYSHKRPLGFYWTLNMLYRMFNKHTEWCSLSLFFAFSGQKQQKKAKRQRGKKQKKKNMQRNWNLQLITTGCDYLLLLDYVTSTHVIAQPFNVTDLKWLVTQYSNLTALFVVSYELLSRVKSQAMRFIF